MSDLIFDRTINKLQWPAIGKEWSAVSGITKCCRPVVK